MNESPEYFLGKVAAHAYADEMRELQAGYEVLEKVGFNLSSMGQGLSQAAGTMGQGLKGAIGQYGQAAGTLGQAAKGGMQDLGTAARQVGAGNVAGAGQTYLGRMGTNIGAMGQAAGQVGQGLKGLYGPGGAAAKALGQYQGGVKGMLGV